MASLVYNNLKYKYKQSITNSEDWMNIKALITGTVLGLIAASSAFAGKEWNAPDMSPLPTVIA
jgi:hypothetical protein